METIGSQATYPEGRHQSSPHPKGEPHWVRAHAPRRPGTGHSRDLAIPDPKNGCDLLCPPGPGPVSSFPCLSLGLGVEGENGDGRGNLASLSQKPQGQIFISSPNVTTRSHRDRGHFCLVTAPLCRAHPMNQYFL